MVTGDVIILAVLSFALAQTPVTAGAAVETVPAVEVRVSPRALLVRRSPDRGAPVRGRIAAGVPFRVLSRADGSGCDPEGWGLVEGGFTCLAGTAPTVDEPIDLPRLVRFDPPAPEDYTSYVKTGVWPRDPASTEAILPYIYGKKWRRWKGANYASLAAWERGDPPVDALADDTKYHFVDVVESTRGPVLVRADGRVVPLSDAFLYPVSRFRGVDLVADPVPEGRTQAWVYGYDGAKVRAEPSAKAAELAPLPHHAALRVGAASSDGRWYTVPNAGGSGVDGWVAAADIRRVRPLPPPPGVAADERWIDVDVEQQVLVLYRGSTPELATLVSTGLAPQETPLGLYRVLDKAVDWDMASLPGAAEPYHVERVPWVVHFRPRYALHGVFWHWGFGNRASHGCVNLAPMDAHAIFDAVSPPLPDGWSSVTAAPDALGTTVRVRASSAAVRDRR